MPTLTQEPETVQTQTQKPVRVIRMRGVSASIFANRAKKDDREMTFHKVSLQRSYKDENEWKQTSSLGRDDLPVAMLLMQRAWEYILDTEAARSKDDATEREEV